MKTNARSRRNFLLAAGLGGVGTVAAVTAGRKTKAGEKKVAAEESSGYRVSEHILKYYKTTEV